MIPAGLGGAGLGGGCVAELGGGGARLGQTACGVGPRVGAGVVRGVEPGRQWRPWLDETSPAALAVRAACPADFPDH